MMTAILFGLAVICAVSPLLVWVVSWPQDQATRRRIVQEYPDELPDDAAQNLADAAKSTWSAIRTTVTGEVAAIFTFDGIIHPGIGPLFIWAVIWGLVLWALHLAKRQLADAAEWQRRWPELRPGLARQLGLNLRAETDPAPQRVKAHVSWQAIKAMLGIR